MKDLKLGPLDGLEDESGEGAEDKTRLAELISAEFSDHKQFSELEAQIISERQLRVTYSKRFEDVSTKNRELETELMEVSGDKSRAERELAEAMERLDQARNELLEAQTENEVARSLISQVTTETSSKAEATADKLGFELETSQAEVRALQRNLEETTGTLERLRAEVMDVREHASVIQSERDLIETERNLIRSERDIIASERDLAQSERDKLINETPEGRKDILRNQAQDNHEDAEKLRDQVQDLQGELEMRMAVLEGLRQDFAGSETLRAENEAMREELRQAQERLELAEDIEGVEEMVHQTLDRAEAAEAERDELAAQFESSQARASGAEERVDVLTQKLQAAQERPVGNTKPWKGLSAALGAGLVVMGVMGGKPAQPEPLPPPVTVIPEATTGPASGRPVDERVLESAALAALDRQAGKLPVAPPPREALRGDLDEYQVLLARVARGDEVEPVLVRFHEITRAAIEKSRRASHVLARVLKQRGRGDEAEELTDQALALAPKLADLHALKGELRLAHEDLKGAEAAFERAIELDDSIARAHGGLAHLLTLKGEEEPARVRLVRALELQPDNPDYHYALAMILRVRGQFSEAVQHLERSLEAKPGDAYAHWYLSEACLQQGDRRQAAEHKARAYQLGYEDSQSGGSEVPDLPTETPEATEAPAAPAPAVTTPPVPAPSVEPPEAPELQPLPGMPGSGTPEKTAAP